MNKIFNKSYIKKTITYQVILFQDNGAHNTSDCLDTLGNATM